MTGKTKLYRVALGMLFAFSATLSLPGCKAVGNSLVGQDPTLKPLDNIFRQPGDYGAVQVNFCTDQAAPVPVKLKYVFVMDKSTSNARNYTMDANGNIIDLTPQTALGTDPDGSRRYASLAAYLAIAPDDPMRYYSLVEFSTAASVVSGFTNDRATFQTLIQDHYNCVESASRGVIIAGCPVDSGATNYNSALDQTYTLINQDITAARNATDPIASAYVIIFLSDGAPITQILPTAPPIITQQTPAEILQRVRNIVGLQNNVPFVYSINLYTGYYFVNGNEDPNARDLLQRMAQQGQGIPSNFGTGEAIDFSRFNIPPNLVKNILKDIMVVDASAVWWDDARLHRDIDGEGLPDDIETPMGSDPTKVDSDENGVSDYIEYRAYGSPCRANPCSTSTRRSFQSANANFGGCSALPRILTANGFTYADGDSDDLNDCEEMFLGNLAGMRLADSNGDYIADGAASRNRLEFKAGSSPATNDPFFDGMNLYSKVKFGLPTFMPLNQFFAVRPSIYDLTIVSSSGTQDCYQLNVTDINLMGPDNIIRVYLFEETNLVFKKQIYHHGEKRFDGASKSLIFNDIPIEATGVWK